MLDFYIIKDEEITPEYPNEQKYIGSVRLEDFILMRPLINFSESINAKLDYHNDFRIDRQNTSRLCAFAMQTMKNAENNEKKAYENIVAILQKATDANNAGIMCFCD